MRLRRAVRSQLPLENKGVSYDSVDRGPGCVGAAGVWRQHRRRAMRMSGCRWKNASRQVTAWDKYEGIGRSVMKAEC